MEVSNLTIYVKKAFSYLGSKIARPVGAKASPLIPYAQNSCSLIFGDQIAVKIVSKLPSEELALSSPDSKFAALLKYLKPLAQYIVSEDRLVIKKEACKIGEEQIFRLFMHEFRHRARFFGVPSYLDFSVPPFSKYVSRNDGHEVKAYVQKGYFECEWPDEFDAYLVSLVAQRMHSEGRGMSEVARLITSGPGTPPLSELPEEKRLEMRKLALENSNYKPFSTGIPGSLTHQAHSRYNI